jgi:hypothetical protein
MAPVQHIPAVQSNGPLEPLERLAPERGASLFELVHIGTCLGHEALGNIEAMLPFLHKECSCSLYDG